MSTFTVLHNAKTNQEYPKVWLNAGSAGILPASYIANSVLPSWKSYLTNTIGITNSAGEVDNAKLDAMYKRLQDYMADHYGGVSPYWEEYVAWKDNEVKVTLRTSKDLNCIFNSAKDSQIIVGDHKDRRFVAGIICCDTPWRTVGFLWDSFMEHSNLSFGPDLITRYHRLTKYVAIMMQIGFACKWESNVPRPADYEVQVLNKPLTNKSIEVVPHPNHPSMPAGHSIYGLAVKKFIESEFPGIGQSADIKDTLRACEEVGLARSWVGIHWLEDFEAAKWLIDTHHAHAWSLL